MKIMLVLHSHKCGGAEKHLLYLAHELQQQGFSVHLACPIDSWLAEQALATGLQHYHLPMHGFLDLWSLWRLVLYVRKERIDLLHGHLMRGAHYALWAGRLCRRPAVATAHSTNTWKHLRHHARIIAVSHAVQKSLLDRGFPAEQIVVVENGIPVPAAISLEERAALRRDLGLAENEFALVNVARFVRDKGQDVLVNALSLVTADSPLPLKLFLVGEGRGAWYEEIERLVKELQLTEKVVFLGHREDVAKILAAMDLFILPSRREALSLAILEAFAASVPVIASATGGIPELVRDGETGRLSPVDDPWQLSRLIVELAAAGEERQVLTRKARSSFLDNFTDASMTRRIDAIYRAVSRDKRKKR